MSDDSESSEWGRFLKPPPLPQAGDRLFERDHGWDNDCVNFLSDDWLKYITGYKDAADILVAYIDDHQRWQDILVYPVIFLYRQYLELAIKNLITQARRLQNNPTPFPKIHPIDELWEICSGLLREISPGESDKERNQISRLIEEFSQVDPTSMASRYPEDQKGNPSLSPGIRHINLRNMREVIDKISAILDGAEAQIEHLSICKNEGIVKDIQT